MAKSNEGEQQLVIEDAFPDRNADLEALVVKYKRAKQAEVKAKDASTARYDAIKELMRKLDLDTYHCYDSRSRVVMRPDDVRVKVEDVKESQPSPYRPQAAEPAA